MADKKLLNVDDPWPAPTEAPDWDRVNRNHESIYAADPANYFIILQIVKQVRESVSEYMAMLSDRPELQTILTKLLPKLCRAGYIEIENDRIIVRRRNPILDLKSCDFEFVPKLLGVVARRIRDNFVADPGVAFKNGDDLAWRAFPDHPKVRRRLFTITNQFLAELDKLTDEVANDPEIVSDRVRFTAYMNGNLEPEDF